MKSRILVLIKGDGTALGRKGIYCASVKNALHLTSAIKGATFKAAVLECTVCKNCFIKYNAIELAICRPY